MSNPTTLVSPPPLGGSVLVVGSLNPTEYFLNNPYDRKEIELRNEFVYNVLKEKLDDKVNRIDCFRNSDLMLALVLYDHLFFRGAFKYIREVLGIELSMRFEETIVKPGSNVISGITSTRDGIGSIIIARKIFRDLFKKETKYKNSSTVCYDRLDCVLGTFRHELIHLYMRYYDFNGFIDSTNNYHNNNFIKLHKNIFGVPYTVGYDNIDVVPISPERLEKIGKTLKKGATVNVITITNNFIPVIVDEEPITFDNPATQIKVKDGLGNPIDVPIMYFKSPPAELPTVKRDYLRPSPISGKEPPKEFIQEEDKKLTFRGDIKKDIQKYPAGLNWSQFRSEAKKYGITDIKVLSEEYKKYKGR